MATFKLNGKDADFRPGELLIHAAARHGVNIPYYCYHPDLSSPANCRMCLVEQVGAPKLIPSCQQPVNEKMDVLTESEKVKHARKDVMEFLLVNHPLDCPICDQAGECKLQQYAYLFGRPASSLTDPKTKLEKRKVLGPHVVLDQERCISCTRCVRFVDEVTKTHELSMVARTNHITVDRHPDRELDNAYSGCVVDMCPVGALTDRQFRFQARVWYVAPTPTACTLCSRGCNVNVDARGERKQRTLVKRIRARRNPEVNGSWICDEGRYAYLRPRDGARPTRAFVAGAPQRPESAPGQDLDAAYARVGEILASQRGRSGWLGVLVSGAEGCGELHALAELARFADPAALLVVPPFEDGDEDAILRRKDKAANRQGARRLGYTHDTGKLGARDVVVVVDADVRPGGLLPSELVARLGGKAIIGMAAHERPWLAAAEAFLPLANAYEKDGTIINFDDVIQRLARVVPAPDDCRSLRDHAAAVAAVAGLPSIEADLDELLARMSEPGPLAPLDPARLTLWGARLPKPGATGAVVYFEEPLQLFTSAPKTLAEGEYFPFVGAPPPPTAIHVAAGLPSRSQVEAPPESEMPPMVTEARQSPPAERPERER